MTPPKMSEAQRFTLSLILLVGALGGFFTLLYGRSGIVVSENDPKILIKIDEGQQEFRRRQAWRYLLNQAAEREEQKRRLASEFSLKKQPNRAYESARLSHVSMAASVNQGALAAEASGSASPKEAGVLDAEVQQAINLVDGGRIGEAVSILEQVLKRDPRNEQALVELAMINLLDLKNSDQAIGYFQRAIEANPTNHVVMAELVTLYGEEGRVEEGLSFLNNLQSTSPQLAGDVSLGIGQIYSMQGRYSESIPYLQQAVSQSGQNPESQSYALRDLADAYSQAGDPEKSVEIYNRIITMHEQEVVASRGAPSAVPGLAEEKLSYAKLNKTRELIRLGDFENAQAMLREIGPAPAGDQAVVAELQSLIRKKSSGG